MMPVKRALEQGTEPFAEVSLVNWLEVLVVSLDSLQMGIVVSYVRLVVSRREL